VSKKDSLARLANHGITRVPDGWRQSRVKYLGTYINGYPFKPDDWGDTGRPILRIQNLSSKDLEPNRYNGEIPDRYLIRKGDILISWSASLGVYRWAGEESWLNQHIFKVVLDPERVRNDYFMWLAEWFINEMSRDVHGSTMQHLTADAFGGFPVLLPPQPEQARIAEYLNLETVRLDALVAAKERMLRLMAEKRRALITRAVTRGIDPYVSLRDSGVPWLGEIPTHWPLIKAKFLWSEQSLPVDDGDEIVTCFRDGQVTLRRNRREEGFTNAVKEIGYQGIRTGHLVLHSMDAFAGAIGVSDSNGKCTPEYIICESRRTDVSNPYFGYLLRVMALNGFIQASCPAVRERAPRIHFSTFGNMLFPLPPIDEQCAIVARIAVEVAKLDRVRMATERTIGLLKARRAALITAAVTGQLQVPGFPGPIPSEEEMACSSTT
jgi:type I restriction enzyme S subunit